MSAELVKKIRQGYSDICRVEDSVAAYTDFHLMLEDEQPGLEIVAELGKDEHFASAAVRRARDYRRQTNGSEEPIFRGSGIIVIGDADGNINAVDYRLDTEGRDLVAEEHGPYQRVAVRKAAQAALLSRMGASSFSVIEQYEWLQEVLEESGLTQGRHHVGYAKMGKITAGASGMLPAEELAKSVSEKRWYSQYLSRALLLGELPNAQSIDALAGWWDLVAARLAVTALRDGRPKRPQISPPLREIRELNLS